MRPQCGDTGERAGAGTWDSSRVGRAHLGHFWHVVNVNLDEIGARVLLGQLRVDGRNHSWLEVGIGTYLRSVMAWLEVGIETYLRSVMVVEMAGAYVHSQSWRPCCAYLQGPHQAAVKYLDMKEAKV